MDAIFLSIGVMIIIATVFAFIAKLTKQPLIPAYIITGLIIGPGFNLITNREIVLTLSEIGIAFLLFIVGLEIDLKKLKDIGLVASLGGLIQSILLFTAGFIVASFMGFIKLHATYIGLIIAFSSTMVVVKLLSDKRELDTLHGRIILGFLLLEDFLAVIVLSALSTLNQFSPIVLLISVSKGVFIIAVAFLLSKYIFPAMFKFSARSTELLFLISLGICFLFSIVLSYAGFSIAIGAFIAGLTLANLPYNLEIIGKVSSLKDFFATIFFVSLGMELSLESIRHAIPLLLVLVIIVIIVKPFITTFICSYFGYRKRTSFLTAETIAQTSEFSLIIASQGLILGHINQEIFSVTVFLALLTISFTSYFIKYEDHIYVKLKNVLSFFDKFPDNDKELEYGTEESKEVILAGYNRVGYSILKTLHKLNKKTLVIEFNPETIKKLIRKKIPCIYGDIGDQEILARLDFKNAKMVISTVPTQMDSLLLIKKARYQNPELVIFVTANHVEEALALYDAGADYVILPHLLGGEHVSVLIEDFSQDLKKMIVNKLDHIKALREHHLKGHMY